MDVYKKTREQLERLAHRVYHYTPLKLSAREYLQKLIDVYGPENVLLRNLGNCSKGIQLEIKGNVSSPPYYTSFRDVSDLMEGSGLF